MTAKHRKAKEQNSHAADADQARAANPAQRNEEPLPNRTARQNSDFDQQRNDEQQYYAGGVAHDPQKQTQARVDRGDPEAGDVGEETRSSDAPYNKTYGHHE
jgi:hypothetical protein